MGMAEEPDNATEKPNGDFVADGDDSYNSKPSCDQQDLTLYAVLRRLVVQIFFPDPNTTYATSTFPHRIKTSVSQHFPRLRQASQKIGRDVLLWSRRGSPLRQLLVVSVGTVILLALTGFMVFMLFFIVATVNAIVISLLVSLAAAGGFLALFFACLTAIYIGALSVTAFAVSTATISAIIAALVVTGWVGFFFTLWVLTKRGVDFAKHSLSMAGSALSSYSAWRTQNQYEPAKVSDKVVL